MTIVNGPWDLERTRELVRRQYGPAQEDLLSPCLESLVARQFYAGYHMANFERLVVERLADASDGWHVEQLLLAANFGESNQNRLLRQQLAAEATACASSLHCLLDTLAHAAAYSLGMNLGADAFTEKQINLGAVQKRLVASGSSPPVADALARINQATDVAYLEALVNHSKHRSVIRPNFVFGAFSGLPGFSIEFEAFAFQHDRRSPPVEYARREVKSSLEKAHGVLSPWIVDVGRLLLDELREGAAAV
jgi:hypothetical protein